MTPVRRISLTPVQTTRPIHLGQPAGNVGVGRMASQDHGELRQGLLDLPHKAGVVSSSGWATSTAAAPTCAAILATSAVGVSPSQRKCRLFTSAMDFKRSEVSLS